MDRPEDVATNFHGALDGSEPPPEWPASLAALWWDAKGDWHRAHTLIADADGAAAAWVHAHLHRREGDAANARYWYGRAGRAVASASLEAERTAIATELLAELGANRDAP